MIFRELTVVKFTKMHGTGNDFIIIEDLENKINDDYELAKKLCDRHFGIGGDGILIVRNSKIADIQMVIINSDGSYASMCGNGIRCFAKYVWEKGMVRKDNIDIETGDGVKRAFLKIEDGSVKGITINMGNPSFDTMHIPSILKDEILNKRLAVNDKEYVITSMLMGVPHTVIVGKLQDYNVEEGRAIEKHEYFPMGTNVNFCEIVNDNFVKVKTWERGAGPTLACGTGCCASVVASNKLGLTNKKVNVEIPGGKLFIEITNDGVLMTGPAEVVFSGECEL